MSITGQVLPDTHDERYRQKLARLLMDAKGYARKDIQSRCSLRVKAGDNCAIVKVDMAVTIADRICMIIKYGPGSLVTRHRPALAASRLLAPYQIPVVVVTNGEDADILDGRTGEVIGSGLENIPARPELAARCAPFHFRPSQNPAPKSKAASCMLMKSTAPAPAMIPSAGSQRDDFSSWFRI